MNEASLLKSEDIEEDRPMPSRNHSRVAHRLSVALDACAERLEVHQQLSLALDGWKTVPDLALFSPGALSDDWLTDEDEVTIAPELVIEILSPHQSVQPLIDKFRQYFHHGVKSCWLVEPATRVISVFPCGGGSRAFTEGAVHDEMVNIGIPLADVFR